MKKRSIAVVRKGVTESSMQLMVTKKNFSVGGNLKSFFVQ